MVQDYINQTYGSDRTLDGILYLHRINAPRFAGSSGEAIRTVRRMCRDENQYHRIAIVTTFWDAITTGTGEQREADLKALPTLLKDLLDHGANMYRMPDSSTGKRDLLQAFMSAKSVLVKPMIKPKSPRVSSPTAPEPDMPNVGGINLNASSGVGQEASLNALARLIQSNEEAFSRREAAFAAREEKLREQESKSLQNENLLKQQFEAKLGEQSKAFKQALSNEKKRANELEVLINDLTEIQLKQNKMQASKDEQIQLLLRKPTGAYIRAQLRIFMHLISKQTDMTEDELAASLHSQRDDKAINLVSNVCDICYSVIYGTYYSEYCMRTQYRLCDVQALLKPNIVCYECPLDGADQHIFLSTGICDSCRDAGKSCSGGHTSSLVKKSTVSGQKCQRARKRSTRLYCISCSWPINGVYTRKIIKRHKRSIPETRADI